MKRALALLPLLAAFGCDQSAELRRRQFADSVAHAEEVVREAPNAGKEAGLSLLAGPCPEAGETCNVKQQCHAAYSLHVEGLKLTQAAKDKMAQGDNLAAAKLLGSAEEKLKLAGGQVATCTDKAAALRRHYKG